MLSLDLISDFRMQKIANRESGARIWGVQTAYVQGRKNIIVPVLDGMRLS